MTPDYFSKCVIGVGIAQIAAVITHWKLFAWRLARIEEKLDRHNGFRDRLTKIETVLALKGRCNE